MEKIDIALKRSGGGGITRASREFSGFTLAEVLITLGIIGIVAAMTLPAVINKTQDKQFKTAFKKQYSAFAQAMEMAYIEDGQTYEDVEWLQMPRYFCLIQKQLKVLNSGLKCDEVLSDGYISNQEWPATGKKYWHNDNKWFDKQAKPQGLNGGYLALSFLLPDGALVNFNCSKQIFIDVNGYKKPNTIGKDIFFFSVQPKQMVPTIVPLSGSIRPNACSINGTNSTPILTKDNYEEDCKTGSGWGCSLLYLLE